MLQNLLTAQVKAVECAALLGRDRDKTAGRFRERRTERFDFL